MFECGPRCRCGPKCINRISQRGLKYRLEVLYLYKKQISFQYILFLVKNISFKQVYRTLKKGWAVRSWDFIPSGAPVCEYTGILRRSSELDNVSENEFIFQIDCWHTMNGIGGREVFMQSSKRVTVSMLLVSSCLREHACTIFFCCNVLGLMDFQLLLLKTFM